MKPPIEPLSSQVFSGRCTAVEAVEECLRRISEYDPEVQSFVAIREEAALAEGRSYGMQVSYSF